MHIPVSSFSTRIEDTFPPGKERQCGLFGCGVSVQLGACTPEYILETEKIEKTLSSFLYKKSMHVNFLSTMAGINHDYRRQCCTRRALDSKKKNMIKKDREEAEERSTCI